MAASAATVDLAGTSVELDALPDGTDYVNSGSEVVDLVVTTANATTNVYGGSISGAIRLVKKGNGVLRLTSANTYTGGSSIDEGILEGRHTGAFGSATITVKGRTAYAAGQFCSVRFCAAGTFVNDIVVENGIPYADDSTGWQTPQIEFSATATGAQTILAGRVTGPSGEQRLWVTDQDAVTVLGKDGRTANCDFRFAGSVTANYLFGSPCNTLRFDGPVTATRMWFNRTNQATNWKNFGDVRFKNAENDIGRIGYGYNYIICDDANVLNGTILSADYSPSEAVWTYVALNGKAQSVGDLATTQSKTTFNPTKLGAIVSAGNSHNDMSMSRRTTLTITPQDNSNTWCPTRFAGALDVVFQAANADISREFYNRNHDTFIGTLTVAKGVFRLTGAANMPGMTAVTVEEGGTFDVQTTTNVAYFAALSSVTVKSGGTLLMPATNEAWPFATAVSLSLETGADCQLPEGQPLEVSELWVDGVRQSGGTYLAGEVPGLSRGRLQVSPYTAEKVQVTWTGAAGAGNTSATEPTNWAGGKVPDLHKGSAIVTVAGGTKMTFAGDAVLDGLAFDLPDAGASFTVEGAGTLTLGGNGLASADATGARTYEIDMPIHFLESQKWNFAGAETTVRLRKTVSSLSDEQLDRFGNATLELYGDNTFTGVFYLTNGVTHVYSKQNGLGTGTALVEMGRMSGGNAQVVFHGSAESRSIAWCQLEKTSKDAPMMRFAEGDTTLAGRMVRTKSGIETKGDICIVVAEGATGRFTTTTQWDVTPVVGIYGPGTLYSGSIKSASHLYLYDALKLHLAGERTYCYAVLIYENVEVFCENDWAFKSSQKMAGGVSLGRNSSRLHLQGHDQGLNFVQSGGEGVIDTPADAPATVYIDFSRTDPRPANMHVSAYSGTVEGPVSFVSVGTNHTFGTVGEIGATGSLTVLSNEVVLAASTTWTNCSAVTVSDRGTLVLKRSGAFNPEINWTLGGDGVVSLDSGCVQKAAALTVEGEKMPIGNYSASSVPSGAPSSVRRHFAGGGVLRVGRFGLTVIFR